MVGFPITPAYLADNPNLKFATGPDDTGVIVSYNTEAPDVPKGANPVLSDMVGLVINPITWTREETLATRDQGLGSFMPDPVTGVYAPVPQYADAQIDKTKGVLVCSTADEDTIGSHGIYHTFDYNFYYFNLRENAANRAQRFLNK